MAKLTKTKRKTIKLGLGVFNWLKLFIRETKKYLKTVIKLHQTASLATEALVLLSRNTKDLKTLKSNVQIEYLTNPNLPHCLRGGFE